MAMGNIGYIIDYKEAKGKKIISMFATENNEYYTESEIIEYKLATKEEIHEEFLRIGFQAVDGGEYYTNGQHDIFDAVDGNVLIDDDGHFYFIDTIIYPSDGEGYAKYHSLSPRFSI